MRARTPDRTAPLDAALGSDWLPAVETSTLVVVVVSQVLGYQLQAVVAADNRLWLVAPVRTHGFLPTEGVLTRAVVYGAPHVATLLSEGKLQPRGLLRCEGVVLGPRSGVGPVCRYPGSLGQWYPRSLGHPERG